MQEQTLAQIKQQAHQYSSDQENWHFHILTPECQLNQKKSYALILENTDTNAVSVCYSDKPYMGVGQVLVKLLHGDQVLQNQKDEALELPSSQVRQILHRAQEKTKSGEFWHHHMLFPQCKFNKHGNKWVIIFEDTEKAEVIESISDQEPKNDLQHIEALFYSQK